MVYCPDKDAQYGHRLCAILGDDGIAHRDARSRKERESRIAAIHVAGHSQNSRAIHLVQSDGETQNGKQPFLYCARGLTLNGLL